MEIDKDAMVVKSRNFRFLLEFQAVKAIFARDGPLLGGGRCHCGVIVSRSQK